VQTFVAGYSPGHLELDSGAIAMPWTVGIDEAGYGPNLGPFVMTAAACHLPECLASSDVWDTLSSATRRHTEPCDARVVVADSKAVYSPARGLAALEHTVHASLHGKPLHNVAAILDCLSPDCHDEVRGEVWYCGTTCLPHAAQAIDCCNSGKCLTDLCRSLDIVIGPIRSVVVCPLAFNSLLRQWGSKGAVLAMSMVRLLRLLPRDGEPVSVFIDKHGGRNSYAAHLQPAFEDGLVMADTEGSQCSRYHVLDGNLRVQISFQPRADASHFCVALASMVSKYLREVLMLEFNRFWQARIPSLKPTAGYPGDSKRFWADIKSVVHKLGIERHTLWRQK
jgi:ribonuclease HII